MYLHLYSLYSFLSIEKEVHDVFYKVYFISIMNNTNFSNGVDLTKPGRNRAYH